MNINEDTLRKLIMQRNTLARSLGELNDRLRNGILNGMLGERSHRRPEMDPEKKCKKGYTRHEALFNCGMPCTSCNHCGGECHMGLEECDVFEAMRKARKLLSLPDAEMPDVKPDDFPKYEPEKYKYSVPPIAVARMIYRLVVGYWCFSDKDNKDMSLAWERAFNDSICILAGEDGPGLKKLLSIKTKEQAEEIIKDQDVKNVKARFLDDYDPNDWDNFDKMSQEEQAKCLIIHFIVLRFEYQFAHAYPGGDIDVYSGVFESIIDLCLKMAGLYPSDRPNSYDFEDEEVYEKKLLEYEVDHRMKIYKFMDGPMFYVEAVKS